MARQCEAGISFFEWRIPISIMSYSNLTFATVAVGLEHGGIPERIVVTAVLSWPARSVPD